MIQTIGILIGGKSTRMGTDKALLTHNNNTFIEHVVAVAEQITDNVILLGQHKNLPQSVRHLPQLPDTQVNKGPIAALHTLLTRFPNTWSLMLACDTPLLTKQTLDHLINNTQPDTLATVYQSTTTQQLHPTTALYHSNLLPAINNAITNNNLSLTQLILNNPHTKLPTTPRFDHDLTNINTPEDHESLLTRKTGT